MRTPPIAEGRRSRKTTTEQDVVPTSVTATTVTTEHRCAMCPLCRCHFDCRPEPVEAVSGRE